MVSNHLTTFCILMHNMYYVFVFKICISQVITIHVPLVCFWYSTLFSECIHSYWLSSFKQLNSHHFVYLFHLTIPYLIFGFLLFFILKAMLKWVLYAYFFVLSFLALHMKVSGYLLFLSGGGSSQADNKSIKQNNKFCIQTWLLTPHPIFLPLYLIYVISLLILYFILQCCCHFLLKYSWHIIMH